MHIYDKYMLEPLESWSEKKEKDMIESLKLERLLLQCELNMWIVLCWGEDHNMLIRYIPKESMRKILDFYHRISVFFEEYHMRDNEAISANYSYP